MDVSLLLADPLSESMAAFCFQDESTDCKFLHFHGQMIHSDSRVCKLVFESFVSAGAWWWRYTVRFKISFKKDTD